MNTFKRTKIAFYFAGLLFAVMAGSAAQADHELPVLPADFTDRDKTALKPALEAYRAEDYVTAHDITKNVLQPQSEGPLAEMTAFLLGDLHLKLAHETDLDHLYQALSAFQEAVNRYPQSENAVRAYWRSGQIYMNLTLYYESIASFQRVLKSHPESRFAPLARLGMAQSYQTWGKWPETALAYEQLKISDLPLIEQAPALFGHADLLYLLNDFETAFRKYTEGAQAAPDHLLGYSQKLFQYGESAYRTGRYGRAREIFTLLFNVYPKDRLASVALARVGDAYRQEEKAQGASKMYGYVRTLYPGSLGERMIRLIQVSRELGEKPSCLPPILPGDPEVCDRKPAQDPEKERLALQEILEQSSSLLQDKDLPAVLIETLFEAAQQLRRKGQFVAAMGIEDGILKQSLPERFRKKVIGAFQDTMAEAVQRFAGNGDDMKIVEMFHSHPPAFTPAMLTGSIGLQVAESHARIGLLSQAVAIYEPIAASPMNPLSETALNLLGKVLFQKGDFVKARQKRTLFLTRYPKSARTPEALADLAETLERQGQMEPTIQKYTEWLRRYPTHPDRRPMALRLARVFEHQADFKEAIKIYLQWLGSEPDGAIELRLRLADAYYRSGQYQRAVPYYEQILKETGPEPENRDWIQFKLAGSYQASGRPDQGRAIFLSLAQEARDELIKQLALEKSRDL